jgi:predicted ATPase
MRRVSRIEVENFKSLVNFTIGLPKFSCLLGLNGVGKSTVLQLIDFLSQLVRGDIKSWLGERKWKSGDLKSKLTKKVNIEFSVSFCDDRGRPAGRWEGIFNPSKSQCTSERIDMLDFVLQTTSGVIKIFCTKQPSPKGWKDSESQITFSYEGSILSALREDLLPPSILDCKRNLQAVKSLDLLAPEYLRQRTRESSGTLGLGGQNLSAVLHEMRQDELHKMIAMLKKAYPHLEGLHAKSLRSGWKQLEIAEDYKGQESGFFPVMKTEARHINDGMLRMIAILAELQSKNRFLLFDEIENGINPELVAFLMNTLVQTTQQVLVTTHSPMILNYLDDDVAREGVIYIYKTQNGYTESIPFFSIPSLKTKLQVMGPGEAFVDTNLTELADELADMRKGEQ